MIQQLFLISALFTAEPTAPAAAATPVLSPTAPAAPATAAPPLNLAAVEEDAFAPLSFLLGEWEGEGGGGPGRGSGSFSFVRELQQRVVVRHNRAEYPAVQGRPATRHDDLMIVYQEHGGLPLRAIYFDSEGHVIQYQVRQAAAGAAPGRRSVVLVSDAAPASQRFRLTYRQTGPDTVDLTFEIAPPERPEAFSPYITASARRRRSQ